MESKSFIMIRLQVKHTMLYKGVLLSNIYLQKQELEFYLWQCMVQGVY